MPGILCEHCTAVCCQYVSLPIDEPEDHGDFEDIRWYLIHDNVSVYIEDGEWFISFHTPCRHLQPDFRCGIYETRPKICRAYTTENCDYHSGDYGWEAHFTCPEHLEAYLKEQKQVERDKKRDKQRGGRDKAARRAAGRPGVKGRIRARRPKKSAAAPPREDRRGVPLPTLPVTPD
jgi:Fe-S-cluster containining protein